MGYIRPYIRYKTICHILAAVEISGGMWIYSSSETNELLKNIFILFGYFYLCLINDSKIKYP